MWTWISKLRQAWSAWENAKNEARAARHHEPEGFWTYKDFNFNTERNEWHARVAYNHGVPKSMSYYIWSVSEENFKKSVEEMLGPDYVMVNDECGNGHGSADIERRSPML